jgi:hypothetical protein
VLSDIAEFQRGHGESHSAPHEHETRSFALKPAKPPWHVFQHCGWQAEGQRNILFHEGLPLLGAEDHSEKSSKA